MTFIRASLFCCYCICGGARNKRVGVKKKRLKPQERDFCGEIREFVVGTSGVNELVSESVGVNVIATCSKSGATTCCQSLEAVRGVCLLLHKVNKLNILCREEETDGRSESNVNPFKANSSEGRTVRLLFARYSCHSLLDLLGVPENRELFDCVCEKTRRERAAAAAMLERIGVSGSRSGGR